MASKAERQAVREAIQRWMHPNARGRTALLELLNYATTNEAEEQPEADRVFWAALDYMSALGDEFDALRVAVVTSISTAYPPAP